MPLCNLEALSPRGYTTPLRNLEALSLQGYPTPVQQFIWHDVRGAWDVPILIQRVLSPSPSDVYCNVITGHALAYART